MTFLVPSYLKFQGDISLNHKNSMVILRGDLNLIGILQEPTRHFKFLLNIICPVKEISELNWEGGG